MSLMDNLGITGLPIFTNTDFGLLGNLIPLILIFGISWVLSKKIPEMLFVQFPLVASFKVFFPFLHSSLLIFSFALFIMSIIGSKGEVLADVKEIPKRAVSYIRDPQEFTRAKAEALKEDKDALFDKVKNSLRSIK